MHHDPSLQVKPELLRQNPNEIRVPSGYRNLAHTDAKPRSNGSKLRQVAVSLQCKVNGIKAADRIEHFADRRCLAVKPDEVMPAQVLEGGGSTALIQVAPVRVKPKRDRSYRPRHKSLMHRLDHSDRNIGLTPKQIIEAVRQRQLYHEFRMPPSKICQDPGRTSTPTTSLALICTAPLTAVPWPDAARSSAAEVEANVSA